LRSIGAKLSHRDRLLEPGTVHREVAMFSEKERKVKELIDEHLEKVGDCLSCFRACFAAFLEGDTNRAESIHENCDYAETEADILRRKIGDDLYSGAFLPIERKDIYMMSESADKIANKAETASDAVVFQSPEIPNEYKGDLHEIVETIAEMFSTFREAVKQYVPDDRLQTEENLSAIREKITKIGVMESEIDKKEEALMRAIFRSERPLANKIQLERFLGRVTGISDVIEDAADRLYVLVIQERI
jgi:predicted phosphate transport protein (TIGR00153 family)